MAYPSMKASSTIDRLCTTMGPARRSDGARGDGRRFCRCMDKRAADWIRASFDLPALRCVNDSVVTVMRQDALSVVYAVRWCSHVQGWAPRWVACRVRRAARTPPPAPPPPPPASTMTAASWVESQAREGGGHFIELVDPDRGVWRWRGRWAGDACSPVLTRDEGLKEVESVDMYLRAACT